MQIHIDYSAYLARKLPPADAVKDGEVRAAFARWKGELADRFGGRAVRIGVFGSNYSGLIAAMLIKELAIGEIVCVLENYEPLKELGEYDHFTLAEAAENNPDLDVVIMSTSPRHYEFLGADVRNALAPEEIAYMFEEGSAGEDEYIAPDTELKVTAIIGDLPRSERMLPITKENTALVLIDVWDKGEDKCHYCETMPRLLDWARRHDVLTVHAPSYPVDEDGRFILKPFAMPKARERQWPPSSFVNRASRYEHLNFTKEYFDGGGVREFGIHACATPVERDREVVMSDLDEVCDLFEENRILYVMYAGGGTAECLLAKSAGYLNMSREGYQPILVRDATHSGPQSYEGKPIDKKAAGIIIFEQFCGCSTTIRDLEDAFSGDE